MNNFYSAKLWPTKFIVLGLAALLAFSLFAVKAARADDLTIATTSLHGTDVGYEYSQTLSATGGTAPYTWSIVNGTLPGSLSLDSSTGQIVVHDYASQGDYDFTVRVTDADSNTFDKDFTITVSSDPDVDSDAPYGSMLVGEVDIGISFSHTMTAHGGVAPYTWSLADGSYLPNGLSLNSETGEISGTPTYQGENGFQIQVTDANSVTSAAKYFWLRINYPPNVLGVAFKDATAETGYDAAFSYQAYAGIMPFTWSVIDGSLPDGLSFDSSTGQITGTVAAAPGEYDFTVQLTDADNLSDSESMSIQVDPLPTLVSSIPDGTVGQYYGQNLFAEGNQSVHFWTHSYWSLISGSVPSGMHFYTSYGDGNLFGIPTTPGTYNFAVQYTDPNGATTSQQYNLTVNAPPSISTTSLANGTVNAGYSQFVEVANGTGPVTWSLPSGSLPYGLSLNLDTGEISGTPTVDGSYDFSVGVTDANGAVVSPKDLSITVNPE